MKDLLQALKQAGFSPASPAELADDLGAIYKALRQELNGNGLDPQAVIDTYLRDLELYGVKANSCRQTRSALSKFQHYLEEQDGSMNLVLAGRDEVKGWFLELQEAGYASTYRRALLTHLKEFFRWAIDEGYILRSPIPNKMRIPWEGRTEIRLPTPEHVRALRRYFNRQVRRNCTGEAARRALRDRAFFAVLRTTGGRKEEIAQLTKKSLDFELRGIYFQTLKAKNGRNFRFVPMPINLKEQSAWAFLLEYVKRYRPTHLFPSGRQLHNILQEACSKVGMPWYHLHVWRHLFKSWHVERVTQREVVEKMMGHVLPGTEEVYTHLTDEFIAERGRLRE